MGPKEINGKLFLEQREIVEANNLVFILIWMKIGIYLKEEKCVLQEKRPQQKHH